MRGAQPHRRRRFIIAIGASQGPKILILVCDVAKTTPSQEAFRQRFCRALNCGALFFVCTHCDLGQRYCGDDCRRRSRLEQLRVASRRHQQSPEGRLDHRDRQRAYRQSRITSVQAPLEESVTHHSSQEQPSSVIVRSAHSQEPMRLASHRLLTNMGFLICQFCEQVGRFLNPFHVLS